MTIGAASVLQPTGNALLDALSPQQFAKLAPMLSRVEMPAGVVVIGPHTKISTVYFPSAGMVSLVRHLLNGDVVEIGVVGREGVVGWPAVVSADMGSIVSVVQLPFVAYSVNAAALHRFTEANPEFSEILGRSMQGLFLQVAQSAACNQRHTVVRRLAKWLLLADDRSSVSPMALTHELLAMMLGIRRAGVTEAMLLLKADGTLGGGHGRVTILDRQKLEAAACECYGVIQEELVRLYAHPRA